MRSGGCEWEIAIELEMFKDGVLVDRLGQSLSFTPHMLPEEFELAAKQYRENFLAALDDLIDRRLIESRDKKNVYA